MISLLTSTWTVENYMIFVWLGIFIIAILVEILTVELVSVWFAGAAFIAFILSWIPGIPYWGEIIAFVLISALLLLCLRPLTTKLLTRKETKSNIEELIGKKAKVVKKISELNNGEIIINGVTWTAVSSEPTIPINEGEVIKIVAINGNKIIVKKID